MLIVEMDGWVCCLSATIFALSHPKLDHHSALYGKATTQHEMRIQDLARNQGCDEGSLYVLALRSVAFAAISKLLLPARGIKLAPALCPTPRTTRRAAKSEQRTANIE
jgi:hypothetical protein